MLPRYLEIKSENEKDRQIIVEALARIAARDAEYAVIFETLKIEAPAQGLAFHDGDEIDWVVGRARFSPATCRLIRELWESKTKFVSKEDVREFVQLDDESKDGSVRDCIYKARREIERHSFPYEIVTIRSKGYELKKASPNVAKKPSKTAKRGDGRRR